MAHCCPLYNICIQSLVAQGVYDSTGYMYHNLYTVVQDKEKFLRIRWQWACIHLD